MQITDQWHYTDRTGAQAGPVSTAELQQMISSGMIPNTALVWKAGMTDWAMHTRVPELQAAPQQPTAVTSPPAQVTQTGEINPYSPPRAVEPAGSAMSAYDSGVVKEYGGIRRLNFFMRGLLLVVAIFAVMALGFASGGEPSPIILLGGFLIFLILYIRFTLQRIRNIGASGWWILLMLVPLVNNLMSIALLSCPDGYADHKKMDTPGIILAVIFGGLLLLSFGLNILSLFA